MTLVEEWRPITGYEGRYSVSNFGRVKSLARCLLGKAGSVRIQADRILSQAANNRGQGYLSVSLWKENKGRTLEVHRLVALAFCERVDGKREVNHIDGNARNNISSNLEWCTRTHNMAEAQRMGRMSASKNPRKAFKHTDDDIRAMRALRISGRSYCSIAKDFDTCREYVREVCLHRVRV